MSLSPVDFYRELTAMVAGKVRIIKEEIIHKFGAVKRKNDKVKDINIIFKEVVSNLPDDTSYYIVIRERLIWINQHDSILRHSSYKNVEKKTYLTMIRNLYELVVSLYDANVALGKLETLLNTCVSLYEEYHSICQRHFRDLDDAKNLSKYKPVSSVKYPADLSQEIINVINYVLEDPLDDFVMPSKKKSRRYYSTRSDPIWSNAKHKRSSL